MDPTEKLDPEIIRTRIRAAIQELPPDTQLQALEAVHKGAVDLSLGPTREEIWVQLGELTVILELADCIAGD